MGKTIELNGQKNRWVLTSNGGRIAGWQALDGAEWRPVCTGNPDFKTSVDKFHAGVMFPWVNRIGGDHWSLDGEPVPLNLSGPHTHLHGVSFDLEWDVVEETATKVVFRVTVEPQKFYPRRVEATIAYEIATIAGAEGLVCSITSRNLESEKVAYVTTGIHPYFVSPFGGPVDTMTLRAAQAKEFAVDDRLIPTGLIPVTLDHDFTAPREIASTQIDSGFVLVPGAAPLAELSIRNFTLAIHPGENCGYAQIYIPPNREEIAIEPQSGGADAFRFPEYGLTILKPGESFVYSSKLVARFV